MQQLVAAFAHSFVNGDAEGGSLCDHRFTTITEARSLAESILNEKIAPGTPTAKLVDEVPAARSAVRYL